MRHLPLFHGVLPALVLALVAFATWAPPASAQRGEFQVRIDQAEPELVVPYDQREAQIEGEARIVGGVPRLDLFLVMDTSKSLRLSDPEDRRKAGAIGLVKSLLWSDAWIGVVDFDKKGNLLAPLSSNRSSTMEALRGLDQDGKTDLAKGIRTALEGFAQKARPNSTRIMLVFTDGRVREDASLAAMEEARARGVVISTLLLGSNEKGMAVLKQMADESGGTFVAVRDPDELPDAFLSLQTGVKSVTVQVGDSAPQPARLSAKGFRTTVPLEPGENRIVARGTSIDGREQESAVLVTVRPPGCARLSVAALQDGRPALSISKRGVEFVVDGSGSMWGRMGGRTKIEIAKEILEDALGWLSPDLSLSLRAYGHRSDRREQDCRDTQLLVSLGRDNREAIRSAIAGLEPKGQTPLAYSLEQVAGDFAGFEGERAVVLVTDGVESCEGDAPSAARALQSDGDVVVHVIGFGLAGASQSDLASLRAIAEASGGSFVTAGSGDALRRALGTSVGTAFRVLQGDREVARSTLGSDPLLLPAGDYRLELDSRPPHAQALTLAPEEELSLVLHREGAEVRQSETRASAEFVACEGAAAPAAE